jgi:hypothetical protein
MGFGASLSDKVIIYQSLCQGTDTFSSAGIECCSEWVKRLPVIPSDL